MTARLFALAPALAFAALVAQPAAGYELPNGNVVWELSAGDYDVRIEELHDEEIGFMSFTNRVTGETRVGDLNPGFAYDRDSAKGLFDEGFARATFGSTLVVEMQLLDWDGTAFDGAIRDEEYPASLLTASPPPLAVFESAVLTFTPLDGSDPVQFDIDRLPEPGVALLALPLLVLLAARRQTARSFGTTSFK